MRAFSKFTHSLTTTFVLSIHIGSALANEPRPKAPPKKVQKSQLFLEVRAQGGRTHFYSTSHQRLSPIRPGTMIEIELTERQMNQKLVSEMRDRQFPIKIDEFIEVNYDWKRFITIDPAKSPMKLRFRREPTVLFKEAGFVNERECQKLKGLCSPTISSKAKLKLLKTKALPSFHGIEVFYQVEATEPSENKEKAEKAKKTIGWAWSQYFERVPTFEPSKIVTQKQTEKQIQKALKEQTDKTAASMSFRKKPISKMNRWAQKTEAEAENSEASQNAPAAPPQIRLGIDFHFLADVGQISISGSQADSEFSQNSLRLGIGGVLPILLDLDLTGTLYFILPATKDPNFDSSLVLVDIEQILALEVASFSNSLIKAGLTARALVMPQQPFDMGYQNLATVQLTAMYENPRFFGYMFWGPTFNAAGVSASNFDAAVRFGYRLNKSRPYKSWSIISEWRLINFADQTGTFDSRFSEFTIGVQKGF